MWFTRKGLLELLSDNSVSNLEKEKILDKKLKKVIKEIEDLSDEEIIRYLFKSKLPRKVKVIICEQVENLSKKDDSTSKKKINNIVDVFTRSKLSREELLGVEFCPTIIKKSVIDEVFGSDLVEVICRKSLPNGRKKQIIDLRLSSKDAIVLLGKDVSEDIKKYVIETKLEGYSIIHDAIINRNIPEDLIDYIITKKVTMDNIFQVVRFCFGNDRDKVYRLKEKELEDYIDHLNEDKIIELISTYDTPDKIVDRIIRNRYDVLVNAISNASNKQVKDIVRYERDIRIISIVLDKRKESIYEVIRELKSHDLLYWLNRELLSDELKDYLKEFHKGTLEKEIQKTTASRADFYYLNERSHLPRDIKDRIYKVCEAEFREKFLGFSDDEVINNIKYGSYDILLKRLLVSLRVDSNNLKKLLEDKYGDQDLINLLFELKGDLIKELVKDLDVYKLLTLRSYIFPDEVKNRVIELSSDYVSSQIDSLSKEDLYNYLCTKEVLVSSKRLILKKFGIVEGNLENILDLLSKDNVDLLVNYYDLIREFIGDCGIDFDSFIQYGSGSKRHSDWLSEIVNIISDENNEEFIRVKNYFFNNFYLDHKENENDVYLISSYLEILENYFRYRDLCVSLSKNNVYLRDEDILNIKFLFSIKEVDGVEVPKTLSELSTYKKKIYENIVNKINSGEMSEEELKKVFNDLVFGNADEVMLSIGGSGSLRTLKKDNSSSLVISEYIDELMLYSRIIEMVNDTNNKEGLEKLLKYVFSDIDTLTNIQNMFGQVEKKVNKLYEVDARNNLTSLDKVRSIEGVLDHALSEEYGGEVFDFSDKNYCLFGHVLSSSENIEDMLEGKSTGKSNFISMSPISYRGQKYYWDRAECILAFDRLPRGSFICSSIHNMGTNQILNNNSSEVDQFRRTQRGILETSAVTRNNSEVLLYRDKIRPCGLVLPGGRKPTLKEMELHKKYNLPFIITQEVMKSIDNPKMVLDNGTEFSLNSSNKKDELRSIIDILSPNVSISKEDDVYTGREVGLFTDSHSMYEPTLAVLEDMRRHGISEIYSLGDNVGLGPNPSEVFDLMEEYGVVSVAGNSEYYNTLGTEPFNYFYPEKTRSQEWTSNKLGKVRIKKMEVYPASIDLIVGGKKLGLCHFANDVRFDYGENSTHVYRANYGREGASDQFLFTNSEEAKTRVNNFIMSHKSGDKVARAHVSAKNEPLFEGRRVTDYDGIIQGHVHFDMNDEVLDTKIHTLRACGMGYEEDAPDTACYYVLREKKEGGYDLEKRLVHFNKNSLLSSIYTSDIPNKDAIIRYVKTDQEMRGFY